MSQTKPKTQEISPKVPKDKRKVATEGLETMPLKKLMMLRIIFQTKLEMPKDSWTEAKIEVKVFIIRQKDMPLILSIVYLTLLKVPNEQQKM